MRALFISDLHLAESRPEANERFISFIEEEAAGADALYILGDLFEYWIGDDDIAEPFNAVMCGFLGKLAGRGVALYLMHGNRDFLMGERFSRETGARLLQDPALVQVDGEALLLLHGDTLCTDDTDYQAWRRTARSAGWQSEFLAKPLEARRAAILELREKSRRVIQEKPAGIMDVSAAAVEEAFRRSGVSRMIHGHTHRPAHHRLRVDGRECERWVLPDWYGRGGYLELDRGRSRLVRFA